MYDTPVNKVASEAPPEISLVDLIRKSNSVQHDNIEMLANIIYTLFGVSADLPTKADPKCFTDEVKTGLETALAINNALQVMSMKVGA